MNNKVTTQTVYEAALATKDVEIQRLQARLASIRSLVDSQTDDKALWFITTDAAIAYVQQELRCFHVCIEVKTQEEIDAKATSILKAKEV